MLSVKRVEIVLDQAQLKPLLRVLEAQKAPGYTVIRHCAGSGDRGPRDPGEDVTDVFGNSYVLTTCLPERLPALLKAIRPLLKLGGGECLVSDAQSLPH